MTNLLPIPDQKAVWAAHRARFLIVFALVLIVLASIAMLVLIPSYLALEIAVPSVADAPPATSSPADPNGIARAQALLKILSPVGAATSSPSAAIGAALQARPKGISITHVSYAAGTPGQIMLTGAGARDAVSAYADALTQTHAFTAVSVPVSALVGSVDNHFSLTLSGAF